MSVKLRAALPKDEESNGLDESVAKELLSEPRKLRVGVVVLAVDEVVRNLANGTETPKVRIERVELFTDAVEADAAVRRVQALSEVRTGATPLPSLGKSDPLDFEDQPDESWDDRHNPDDEPEAA